MTKCVFPKESLSSQSSFSVPHLWKKVKKFSKFKEKQANYVSRLDHLTFSKVQIGKEEKWQQEIRDGGKSVMRER